MSADNARRGMVDYLEPEFLHALGIAVATFALVETLLKNAFFHARHGHMDFEMSPLTVLEISDCNFAVRIDKLFKELRGKVEDFAKKGLDLLQEDFHKIRVVRNLVVHGMWKKTNKAGFYKCSSMDEKGRSISQPVSKEMLLGAASTADNLMVELKSLLVAEGLYPPIGPRI